MNIPLLGGLTATTAGEDAARGAHRSSQLSRRWLRFIVALALIVGSPVSRALADVVHWTNAAGGLWNNPANWTPHAPTAADDVFITLDGTYTVTLNVNPSVANLNLGSATSGTQTLSVPGLTLSVAGTLTVGQRGNVYLQSGALAAAVSSEGGIVARGGSSITGVLTNHVSGSFHVEGRSGFGNADVSVGSIANYGTIRIETTAGGEYSLLLQAAGTLTNHPSGVINVNAGSGGPRYVRASIDNQGAINLSASTNFDRGSTTFENKGTLTIAAAGQFYNPSQSHVFTQTSGTIANSGEFRADGTTFNFNGGSISGNDPILHFSTLNIGAASMGAGAFRLRSASALSGDIQPGQTVWVEGRSGWGNAEVGAATGFTNHGTLRLQTSVGGEYSLFQVNSGAVTNAADGVIEVNGGSGGPRYFRASAINEGLFDVNAATQFDRAGTTYSNSGQWNFDAGQTNLSGAASIGNSGTMAVAAGAVLNMPVGSFTNTGGTLAGGGTIIRSPLANDGEISPGASADTLTVSGAVQQTAASSLTIELGGLFVGTQYDRLSATGASTLNGALNVSTIDGFVPSIGNSFDVFTAPSYTGTFSSVSLPPLASGSNRHWVLTYNSNNVRLTVDGDPATSLTLGETVSGTISVADEVDEFGFTVAVPTRAYFDSLTNRGDIRWSLTGPGGSIISNWAFNQSDGPAVAAPVLMLAPGAYTLQVNGVSGATGGYLFRLDDLASATAISSGSSLAGALDPAIETDLFKFTATAGDRLFYDFLSHTGLASATLRLAAPDGSIVSTGSLAGDREIDSLPQSGTYTVLTEGDIAAAGSGTFEFTVFIHAPPTPVALTIGDSTAGQIDPPGERDVFTISLGGVARLYFDSLTNRSDLNWSLDGPGGVVVNARAFHQSDGASVSSPVLSLVAGDYTLTVDGSGAATGPYEFRLLDLSAATALTLDAPTVGSLNPANETDVFAFAGAAGDQLFFDSQSVVGLPGAVWRLIGPTNLVVFSAGLVGDVEGVMLSAAGTYTLLVEGGIGAAGSGTYAFTVQTIPEEPTEPIELGETVSASLVVPGERRKFSFSLAGPLRLYFDSRTNRSNLNWTIETTTRSVAVGPRAFHASDSGGIANPVFSLGAGDYEIVVAGAGQAVGGFSFRLFDPDADAVGLTLGTTTAGSLTPGNGTDVLSFAGVAGKRYFFDAVSRDATIASSIWRLIAPDSSVVFSTPLSSNAEPPALTQNGAHLLLVEGGVGDSSDGSYSFAVHEVPDLVYAPLTLGSESGGAITTPGEIDGFEFAIGSASRLYFDSLTNRADINWTLVRFDGGETIVVNPRAFSASDGPGVAPVLALSAGTYRIRIDAVGDVTGAYAFRLSDLSSAPAPAVNTPISDMLDPGRETDIYSLSVGAPGAYLFDHISRSGLASAAWRLVAPDNSIVFSNGLAVDSSLLSLSQTEIYSLLVEGAIGEAAAGTYSFQVVSVGADLVVDEVTVSTSGVFGQEIEVSWTVRNAGSSSADGAWSDRLYLSADGVFDAGDRLLTTVAAAASPLGAGNTYSRMAMVTPPLDMQAIPGPYHVIVQADSLLSLLETSDSNNSAPSAGTVALTRPPEPDLIVESISAPASARPGTSVNISWTIKNNGAAAASGAWSDRVLLSNDEAIGADTVLQTFAFAGLIGPGDSQVRMQSVTIPESASGAGRIVVVADALGQLGEGLSESNNSAIDDAEISFVTPDLVVDSVSSPATGEFGSAHSVTWTVRNTGAIETDGNWQDAIYLSQDLVIGAGDTLLASIPVAASPLVPDATYMRTVPVNLPLTPAQTDGTYYVLVRTDVAAVLPESNEGNNDAAGNSVELTRPAQPDLVITMIVPPSAYAAGESVPVSWTVRNQGSAPAEGSWTETLFGSSDTNLGNDLFIESFSVSGPLNPGESITRNESMTVPSLPAGYHVVACADTGGVIAEPDDANNCRVADTRSDLLLPDLVVTEFSPPGAALADSMVSVPWTVTNSGAASANGSWTDRLYLSADPALDPGDTLLASRVGQNGLGIASPYSRSANVKIPSDLQGTFYFIVRADDGNALAESDEGAGNTGTGTGTDISQPPRPNLIVTDIAAPSGGLGGTAAQVSFTVTNIGPATAIGIWSDAVYASSDTILDSGDALLGSSNAFSVNAGGSYTKMVNVNLPDAPGDYYIIVAADASSTLKEGLSGQENDNTLTDNETFAVTSFSVVISATPVGTRAQPSFMLSGLATIDGTGDPAPGVRFPIRVRVQATRRVIFVTTQMDGTFETTFTPLPGEAGIYYVAAAPSHVLEDVPQDSFTLYGMRLDPQFFTHSLLPSRPREGTFRLRNLGDTPLTGLTLDMSGVPPQVQLDLGFVAASMGPNGVLEVPYTISALVQESVQFQIVLAFGSAEGAEALGGIVGVVVPDQPNLVALPTSLTSTMVRGGQQLLDIQVSNTGGAPALGLELLLPPADWLQSGTPAIPDLEPGESTHVLVHLLPDEDLPLGPYTGTIVVAGGGLTYGVSVPFNFRLVSDRQGDLAVRVQDEVTFYATGAYEETGGPLVTGATVTLRDGFTGQVVAQGTTSSSTNPLVLTGVPEGNYFLRAEAPGHSPNQIPLFLPGDTTTERSVFLPQSVVSYSFKVEPVDIEDTYSIVLETTFATFVPLPVITIEPNTIKLIVPENEPTTFEVTIRNSGLIAAPRATLTFPVDPDYEIKPLIEDLGDIPAMSEITIPVSIRYIGPPLEPGQRATEPCDKSIQGGVAWILRCDGDRFYYQGIWVLPITLAQQIIDALFCAASIAACVTDPEPITKALACASAVACLCEYVSAATGAFDCCWCKVPGFFADPFGFNATGTNVTDAAQCAGKLITGGPGGGGGINGCYFCPPNYPADFSGLQGIPIQYEIPQWLLDGGGGGGCSGEPPPPPPPLRGGGQWEKRATSPTYYKGLGPGFVPVAPQPAPAGGGDQ